MNKYFKTVIFSSLFILGFSTNLFSSTKTALENQSRHLDEVWARFFDPPAPFRPAPLYVWNDLMEKEEIARQLDGFKAQGFGGVFVHPRPGLVTPYLSKEWLDLWRFTVAECKKRSMVAYIYDENSYPSGFAGGHVPDQMPESRQVILRRDTFSSNRLKQLAVNENTIALYRIVGGDLSGRYSLAVEPDGKTVTLSVDGIVLSRFKYRGKSFEGGVGFRSIIGRNCKVDDVLFYQKEKDGTKHILLRDDFNRNDLGPQWVNETLASDTSEGPLNARIEDGVLVLKHNGSKADTWLRPAAPTGFTGRTTVFEFTLLERSGEMSINPALVVGTKPFRAGTTGNALLLDIHESDSVNAYGMVKGAWVGGQADSRSTDNTLSHLNFERVELPERKKGEKSTAMDLGLPPGTYVHYYLGYGGKSAWLGGRFYVDLMRPGVGEKFLDITFGAYDSVLKDEYGKGVLACFTDEPHITGGWTPTLPDSFRRQWRYSILDVLPSVHMNIGPWRAVRHDYAATLLSLYTENFVKPFSKACAERNIAFTGHAWEHGWPGVGHGPDVMSFNAWQQAPGIDCLMNSTLR